MDNLDFDFINVLPFIKRPFRAKFVPAIIWNELDQFKNDSESLSKYLSKFKTKLNFAFTTVSGEFDGDKQTIHIYIYDGFDFVEYDSESWDEFKFAIIQTMMHEIIHWSQYSMRGNEICWQYSCNHTNQEYYSLSDEIHAYSHCIFLESIFAGKLEHSTKDEIFKNVFNNDYSNKALKEYQKWINRWQMKYSPYINR